jgi:hypothetical protein
MVGIATPFWVGPAATMDNPPSDDLSANPYNDRCRGMEEILDPRQVNRMLRDVAYVLPKIIVKVRSHAADSAELLRDLDRPQVLDDDAYRGRVTRYACRCGHIRYRKAEFLDLFEQIRSGTKPGHDFESALQTISIWSGHLEKSAASAVSTLFDQEQPLISTSMRKIAPRYGLPKLTETPSFEQCIQWNHMIRKAMKQVVSAPDWRHISNRIDREIGNEAGALLGDVRKLAICLENAKVILTSPT